MSPAPLPNPVQSAAPEITKPETERLLAILCYGLFLLALANGVTALIGVVVAYLRREPSRGTFYESHYANLITVFWVSLAVGLLSFVLLLNGIFTGLSFMLWRPWRFHIFGWHQFDWGPPLAATAIPLALFASIFFVVWYLYRVLRGFIRALDEKPY